MWFDLSSIGEGSNIFYHILPFANGYDVIKYTLLGEYSKILIPLLIVLGYTIVIAVLEVYLFVHLKNKLK